MAGGSPAGLARVWPRWGGMRAATVFFFHCPVPMWICDARTLRFLEVNEAACVSYGYTRDEFLQMTLADIQPPGDVERLQELCRRVGPRFQASGEWRHVRRDGTVVDVEIFSHRLRYRGHPAIMVAAYDVTARRRGEEALREALALRHAFLTAISHELRTPLTTVLGVTKTLQRHLDQLSREQVGTLLERLASGAERLERLLRDVLDVDRLMRGVVEARPLRVDLAGLVGRVVAGLDRGLHKVELEVEEVTAEVDPALTERIVEHLFLNAMRFSPEGSRIAVRLRREPEGVLVGVEDEGPGVPEEARQAIFEPFSQLQVPEHAPGMGVGLALVRRFAELQGGRVWVEEREGGGSSFRVFLPQLPCGGGGGDLLADGATGGLRRQRPPKWGGRRSLIARMPS